MENRKHVAAAPTARRMAPEEAGHRAAASAAPTTLARREALRRAAGLGAAAIWAAPAVLRVGMTPVLAVSPPPPPPSTPPRSVRVVAISFVGLVVTCSGVTWRGKWEAEGGGRWVDVTSDAARSALPQCPLPAGWGEGSGLPAPRFDSVPAGADGLLAIEASRRDVGGELHEVMFLLPEGCAFQDGIAKGGEPASPRSGGYCVAGVASGRTVTFTASA